MRVGAKEACEPNPPYLHPRQALTLHPRQAPLCANAFDSPLPAVARPTTPAPEAPLTRVSRPISMPPVCACPFDTTCACTCVYAYVCVCVWLRHQACAHVRMCVCAPSTPCLRHQVSVHVYLRHQACVCLRHQVCPYVCVRAYVYVYVHVYVYVPTHTEGGDPDILPPNTIKHKFNPITQTIYLTSQNTDAFDNSSLR